MPRLGIGGRRTPGVGCTYREPMLLNALIRKLFRVFKAKRSGR